jgi:hypothetical protein
MADQFYDAVEDMYDEDLNCDPSQDLLDADDEDDEPLGIPTLHAETTAMFAVKTKAIASFTPLPTFETIYFHENRALAPTAPADLQLAFFFAIYNDIAAAKFVAQKDNAQDMDISRAIWYYGNDLGHSFSRFWDQVR